MEAIEVVLYISNNDSEKLWRIVKRACLNIASIIKKPVIIQRITIPGTEEKYTPIIKVNNKIIRLNSDYSEVDVLVKLLNALQSTVCITPIALHAVHAIGVEAYA